MLVIGCADDLPPPPPAPLVETMGPAEAPIGGLGGPDAAIPPDVPDVTTGDVTTGVDTMDPRVPTEPTTPSFPPGVTTIDPMPPGVGTIGPQPPGPPTGTEGPCFSVCDCPPGLSCLQGFCQATIETRWCCTEAACPSGAQCETPGGRIGLCPP